MKKLITPDEAKRILENNEKMMAENKKTQRKMHQQSINVLADAMTNGKFLYNGETIKFDIDGFCFDGIHRLRAVVQSGIAQEFEVIYGLPADAGLIHTIDIGRKRSLGDNLNITYGNVDSKTASILKTYVGLTKERASQGYSMANMRVSQAEMLSYYDSNKAFFDRVTSWAKRIYNDSMRKITVSEAGGLYAYLVLEGNPEETVADFFDRMVSASFKEHSIYRTTMNALGNEKHCKKQRMIEFIRGWNAHIHKSVFNRPALAPNGWFEKVV